MFVNRRKTERRSCRRIAKIQSGAGSLPRDCTITDISITGAKMTVTKPVAVGEMLVVRSRRFTARARVAWAESTIIGLEFLEANERLMNALDAP